MGCHQQISIHVKKMVGKNDDKQQNTSSAFLALLLKKLTVLDMCTVYLESAGYVYDVNGHV